MHENVSRDDGSVDINRPCMPNFGVSCIKSLWISIVSYWHFQETPAWKWASADCETIGRPRLSTESLFLQDLYALNTLCCATDAKSLRVNKCMQSFHVTMLWKIRLSPETIIFCVSRSGGRGPLRAMLHGRLSLKQAISRWWLHKRQLILIWHSPRPRWRRLTILHRGCKYLQQNQYLLIAKRRAKKNVDAKPSSENDT